MSSSLKTAITAIQQNDCVTLSVLTAVGYDYVLTFSDEVEYIWKKPWTLVSTLFVLVRYFGFCYVILPTFLGSSFLPGPTKRVFQGYLAYLFGQWTYTIFIGAADLAMILRVWAMYHQSRLILAILLTVYAVETILNIIISIVYSTPNRLQVLVAHVFDITVCVVQPLSTWTRAAAIPELVLGVAMCTMLIIRFTREALQMYKTTKQLKVNRYINLFVKEGILYFLVILLFNIVAILPASETISTQGWGTLVLAVMEYVPVFILTPRFIINIRRLYASSATEGGLRRDVDNGFGLSTLTADQGASRSAMMFAEAGDGLERSDEIPMEEGSLRQWNVPQGGLGLSPLAP